MTAEDDQKRAEQLEAEINTVLVDLFARHGVPFVQKWVVLAEGMAEDTGKRELWTFASEDMKAWDTVGFLGHALHVQHAQTTWVFLDDHGGDEDAG